MPPGLADVGKPSPGELKDAIRLLKKAGLPFAEVERLTTLFELGPPPPPPPLETFARLDRIEVVSHNKTTNTMYKYTSCA